MEPFAVELMSLPISLLVVVFLTALYNDVLGALEAGCVLHGISDGIVLPIPLRRSWREIPWLLWTLFFPALGHCSFCLGASLWLVR